MSTTPIHPLLERLDERLLGLDQKPQFAWPPLFPEHSFEEVLKKLFAQPNLKLIIHHKGWQEGDSLFQGFGENIRTHTFECTPIKEPLFFLYNHEDMKGVMQELLGGEKIPTPFLDEGISTGFTQYLALEILQYAESLKCFSPFSPKLAPPRTDFVDYIKRHPHYVIDVSIKMERRIVWGRLLVSNAFRNEWNQEAASFPRPPLREEQMKKIQLDVACVVGLGTLSYNEWSASEIGDLIILDKCHFFPQEGKGNITLFVGNQPLYRGKLKEGKLKVLDMLNFDEGQAPMDNEFQDEQNEVEEDELEEEELEENEDEIISEEDTLEEDVENDIDQESSHSKAHTGKFTSPGEQGKFDDLPIELHVELGRLTMTLLELTQLSPGNVFELPQEANQGVDLVVNGKRVGRGEIVKIGETLGVRILAL